MVKGNTKFINNVKRIDFMLHIYIVILYIDTAIYKICDLYTLYVLKYVTVYHTNNIYLKNMQ